jgi:UPF0755 protein
MRRILAIGFGVAVVGALAGGIFYFMYTQALTDFSGEAFGSAEAKTVNIAPGSSPKTVAQLLAEAKVVASADLFYRFLRRGNLGPKLKAGEYEFQGPLTPGQVADKIVKGDVKLYHFTVAEGLRVDEILPILADSELKLTLSKLQALAKSTEFVKKNNIPGNTLEGFLFPDTYSFTKGSSEETVLSKMVQRAFEEFKKAPRKTGVDLDLQKAMTLASIVEKETGAKEERPRIACVFHNRLKLGMKLQTDPTVIYAKMLRTGSYSKNITRVDLDAPHPYNTYSIKGLPPGPIASPGAAAIQAALSPLECNDLFFVSRNDGTHVFCPDLKCHEANVEKWQRAFFKKQ